MFILIYNPYQDRALGNKIIWLSQILAFSLLGLFSCFFTSIWFYIAMDGYGDTSYYHSLYKLIPYTVFLKKRELEPILHTSPFCNELDLNTEIESQ